MNRFKTISILLLLVVLFLKLEAQEHPNLVLTKKGVALIKEHLNQAPLFGKTLYLVKEEVDGAMTQGLAFPVPKDLAGGYTHETHKFNFFILQKAGALFQITGDERYARFVKDALLQYKALYSSIGVHPAERSYARGKLFWQCLNDANWLVYVSQAYDCIYDWLDKKEREDLNDKLFRPMADFLSIQNPQFFNRIHNHSTWGNAAVGMIGLVMGDEELINRALYGLPMDTMDHRKDNDGGEIQIKNQSKAGFLAQIEHAFSPDGYYTEGPYYQRYAMYPFLIFAMALSNADLDINIFKFREGVLIKAVDALLNQTDSAGKFFPLNDAQKGMSYLSRELVTALSCAYFYGNQDPALLSIVELQGKVPLDGSGMATALAIAKKETKAFNKKSMLLRDGPKGNLGGIAILRNKKNGEDGALVMKFSQHGMGHGHFDRLSFSLYHQGDEMIQDYGAARWVNIKQKDGGGYLKENKTWAKQTIAHNTLVVNGASQFNGDVQRADAVAPTPFFFGSDKEEYQVVSAKENNAYGGVELHRTMFLLQDAAFSTPLVIDLFRVRSQTEMNSLELPFYFQGQLLNTTFDLNTKSNLVPMGASFGYQHLYTEASAINKEGFQQLHVLHNNKFLTLSTLTEKNDVLGFSRIGANDPDFNLRRDPVFIISKNKQQQAMFFSAIEIHGAYSAVTELASQSESQLAGMKIWVDTEAYTIVQVKTVHGVTWTIAIANQSNVRKEAHEQQFDGQTLRWKGPYYVVKN